MVSTVSPPSLLPFFHLQGAADNSQDKDILHLQHDDENFM
jgi:hypothetical protein